MAVKGWIEKDESAKEMVCRVGKERPFFSLLLPPPLHRLPLRVGNVLELVGASPSAKTHLLIHTAIDCVLPKACGGLGRLVVFVDLDCRFDIFRFSHILKRRIKETRTMPDNDDEEELFAGSIKRFLYLRCHDSLEFLAALKSLHYQLLKEEEAKGVSAHFLMIDSIGAFYWVDRASTTLHLAGNDRKGLSLQNVSESVVQEIKKLLLVHPMLVIATKATILGDRYASNEVKLNLRRPNSPVTAVSRNLANSMQQLPYREYMPSVWQSFVTHRILVRATDEHSSGSKYPNHSIYLLEWLLPQLGIVESFIVKEVLLSLRFRIHVFFHHPSFLADGENLKWVKNHLGLLPSRRSNDDNLRLSE